MPVSMWRCVHNTVTQTPLHFQWSYVILLRSYYYFGQYYCECIVIFLLFKISSPRRKRIKLNNDNISELLDNDDRFSKTLH